MVCLFAEFSESKQRWSQKRHVHFMRPQLGAIKFYHQGRLAHRVSHFTMRRRFTHLVMRLAFTKLVSTKIIILGAIHLKFVSPHRATIDFKVLPRISRGRCRRTVLSSPE